MQDLKELLAPTSIGVWTMQAVSKCGTAIKFRKGNGAEVIVTISKARQWVQEEKCTIEDNKLIWNIEKLDKPEF